MSVRLHVAHLLERSHVHGSLHDFRFKDLHGTRLGSASKNLLFRVYLVAFSPLTLRRTSLRVSTSDESARVGRYRARTCWGATASKTTMAARVPTSILACCCCILVDFSKDPLILTGFMLHSDASDSLTDFLCSFLLPVAYYAERLRASPVYIVTETPSRARIRPRRMRSPSLTLWSGGPLRATVAHLRM